ncbi:uncharacterized protein LOC6529978 [Drosophila yakuba]|uniref:CCDC113/CCDC96 coiled-coil domain-containing protein n=1 Tax=Drosophila yakuba TaxID=7245 RepID=B4P4J7_DROYA|nr:uncharacterized protein LOC6529978 [Drosophila yakuba]EDW90636.1 uncharacterized protein Dyak_GE13375 [Drosophila yakuba]
MSQDPVSTQEVFPAVETIEAGEKSVVDTVPEVVPQEREAEAEGISKPEEGNQPLGDAPREEKPQNESIPITALEATEEGQETETIEHEATKRTEQTEASDDLSAEERKLKLKKERKERLKNLATTRFAPIEFEDKVSFVGVYKEEVRDNEVEEEEDHLANIDGVDGVDEDADSSATDESEDELFLGPKMVSLFPTYGFSDGPVDRSIFQTDVKFEDIDYSASLTGISIVSTRTLKSERDPDSVQMKTNFLRDFDVPSLSDISEEHEPSAQSPEGDKRSLISVQHDDGFYADPTSKMDSSSSSASESVGDIEEEHQAEDAAPESEVGSLDISDIPEFNEPPVFRTSVPEEKHVTLDEFTILSKVAFSLPEIREDRDISLAFEIKSVVTELLFDLFEETAKISDLHNKENEIRAKLDKSKLLDELQKAVSTYLFERSTNEMVGNRLIEYFKRNRNARVFVTLSQESDKRFHSRYMQALALLDSLKYRLVVAKHKHAIQMNRVILDLHSAQSLASITEERFEHLLRKHLVRADSDYLRRLVDRELRLMTVKRNEISDARLFLIIRKHTLGHIFGKIQELETLSDSLSIRDFLAVQNDVIALQKKIEERTVDLKRMRTQFLMDVHLTRHNREKALALGEKFELQKILLRNAIKNQRNLRRRLYEVKLERKTMRQQLRDLTFQGGILSMPSLMYDFDNTVERLKEKRETVAKLRETMKALQRRVSQLEARSI